MLDSGVAVGPGGGVGDGIGVQTGMRVRTGMVIVGHSVSARSTVLTNSWPPILSIWLGEPSNAQYMSQPNDAMAA